MKKEQAIKVTVTRYYDPSEVNIDYSDLLESVGLGDGGFRVSGSAKEWLKQNMKAVASYDKHSVDEGTIEVVEFLDVTDEDESPEYLFEVVEFTTHDDGHVTEEVIHVCRDETYDLEVPKAGVDSEITKLTVLFYKEYGRVPSLREILLMREAGASVALDKSDDGQTWSVGTREPDA